MGSHSFITFPLYCASRGFWPDYHHLGFSFVTFNQTHRGFVLRDGVVMGVKSEGAGDGDRGYIYNLESPCFVEPRRCYSVNTNPITSSS